VINRISIQGYKSLQSVEVSLEPLTVLFGPNSAGKSNFLDAIQLLARLGTAKHIKEAFESPYRGTPVESCTFDEGGVAELMERPHLQFSIEVDIELGDAVIESVERRIEEFQKAKERHSESATKPKIKERRLRYRVTIEVQPDAGIIHVVDEFLAALNERGDIKQSRNAFIEKMDSKSGGRLHLRMEGQAHPLYFELCPTPFCRCPTIRHTTRISKRFAPRWNVGSSSTSSRANGCAVSVRSKRSTTSV